MHGIQCQNSLYLHFFTALAGIDYDALSFDGIFEKCVNITIIKDDLFEFDETFTLVLNASDPNVNIGNNVTTITITDKDGQYCS